MVCVVDICIWSLLFVDISGHNSPIQKMVFSFLGIYSSFDVLSDFSLGPINREASVSCVANQPELCVQKLTA